MVIVISSPERLADESIIINDMFDAGMQLFHLRKPDYTIREINILLDKVNSLHFSKIVLHQHHEIAGDYSINRLHFTESKRIVTGDAELVKAREVNILSTSVHSMETYKKIPLLFDYAFYGPVFNSISKPGYAPCLKEFHLTGIKNSTKIFAIGGIRESNLQKALEMGFDGVAVLGAIWQSPRLAVMNYKIISKKCLITVL